ncbi:flagellar filament capping protein FliD [Sandarakinorhabdus sp.]|uniref:flagellar filament capping protein FliD n=1 Tax=Sandarakinorhabdus sp. TaxID=1916663 RepID=UPI00286DF4A9|nr:flagellar filament capping protein FliD [Sandarakinorhabdus sp.]
MASIANTLGAGSGIDTRALIDGLVAAEREGRTRQLGTRAETLGARISALGQVRSALQGIATSLDSRVRSGSLGVGISSSDAAISVERRGLGPPLPTSYSLSVTRLAASQRLLAAPLAAADAPVGEGVLTIGFGRRTELADGDFSFAASARPSIDITITPGNNSLTGLRDAINASGAGITASIVSSEGSATLVLRGSDGADNGFVISAAPAPGSTDLARFNHTPGARALSLSQSAGDAELMLDGVPVRRPGNSIDDLIPGARLRLTRPASGVAVTAARSGNELSTTVSDFAETLSAMRGLIRDFRRSASNGADAGALAGDTSIRSIDQQLTGLVSARIPAANGLSLADLGVSITREGDISFNAARLAALPPERQGDAEALLRHVSGPATVGQPLRLQSIAAQVSTAVDGITRRRTTVTGEIAKAEARLTTYRLTLVRQFAAMDAAVAASKAVGSQLDQQIAFWTSDNN